ncbi:MAG TPA: 4-(cytidine 5'-diphospho)-2-C-methyl-D-erythritol kinase [Chromatiales bacterium]|nr:4-(cytidine 5'-diphospho)-2-C-methyl-D-erythritol kinase [Thiotrichales bacterium]HIP69149.1 4-(cytidine 5'-diphospho)-2-C-methyl-D-erythritol kinase [Chromatiales bacterium]
MIPPGLPRWPAPAKLNLFLHITGRRKDGYHNLQTVFQLLDYSDELVFSLRDDGKITRPVGPDTVSPEQDLTVQAARCLQQQANISHGVDIYIEKKLPMGGGLGGGSSDAATTLVALNQLWQCGLNTEELAEMGGSVGADVPVFIHGHSAWAEGIGEQLTALELPERWFLVLRPPVEVNTAALFAAPELTRDCKPITIADFLETGAGNVFEPVVRTRYPEVAEALDWLGQTATARLTGTGSCVFASFPNRQKAEQMLVALPDAVEGFVARGVNRSPLLTRL